MTPERPAPPRPTEIRVRRATQCLEVDFDDGTQVSLPAELLRVESPSAAVQGHTPDQKQTVPGKRGVNIAAVEPIGHYAVRIKFSDGHDTGIYSWTLLHQMGRDQATLWAAYLEALAQKGLQRDP
jgi:DUF971 family protein